MCHPGSSSTVSIYVDIIEQFDEGRLSTMVSTKTGVKGIKAVSQLWEEIRKLLNHSFFNNFTDTWNDGDWPIILK